MTGKTCLAGALACLTIAVSDAATADIDVPADYITIQEAIDVATTGETINVAPGLYRENLNFMSKTIQLIGTAGASATILDGVGGTVIDASYADSEIAGFTITHQGTTSSGNTIRIFGGSPWIHDNVFESNTAATPGIVLNGAVAIIERNLFRNNTCSTGSIITMSNGGNPVVRNNIFYDNQCGGVDVNTPGGVVVEVANNLFYRNQVGMTHSTFVSSSNQFLTNNILAGNVVGLLNNGQDNFNWRNNLVWENDTDYLDYPDPTGTTGNLSVNPLFTDPDRGNFHLLEGSPAIDTGLALAIVPDDIDGQARPIDGDGDGGAEYDIGPDEYSPWFGPFPEGTTVFVAADNPAPGVGSEYRPFNDLQTAIDAASVEDVVGVAAGTYPGPVTMQPRVDMIGLGPGISILDGLDAGSVVICADQTRLEGFTITGARFGPAIDCNNGSGMLIKGNLLTGNNERAIVMFGSTSTIIENNIEASEAAGNLVNADAIVVQNSSVTIERNRIDVTRPGVSISAIAIDYFNPNTEHGFVIRDNIIIGRLLVSYLSVDSNAGAAIIGNLFLTANGFSNAINVASSYFGTILNNTIVGGAGLYLQGGDYTVGTVINNIIYNGDIDNCGNDNNLYANNNVFSPTSAQRGCTAVLIGENGNVSINPLFVDADQGDYRLQADSPMINAGETLAPSLPATDLDGLPRIAGGKVDIGAFEFQGFDIDNDQVFDYLDNCTLIANPDQTDSDADGFGNHCDPDLNNDGIVNFLDLAAITDLFFAFDGDPDFDPAADFNVDLRINAADLHIMRNHLFGPPGPAGIH